MLVLGIQKLLYMERQRKIPVQNKAKQKQNQTKKNPIISYILVKGEMKIFYNF